MNPELAWNSGPRFSEARVPVPRNADPIVDFAFQGSCEREPETDTPSLERSQDHMSIQKNLMRNQWT